MEFADFGESPRKKKEKNSFTLHGKSAIMIKTICASGSMDRASDSGSEGWGFESLLACHEKVTFVY